MEDFIGFELCASFLFFFFFFFFFVEGKLATLRLPVDALLHALIRDLSFNAIMV